MTIRLDLLGQPPSDNNAYRTGRHGGRRHLTSAAKAWKQRVTHAWLTTTTAEQRAHMRTPYAWRMRITYLGSLYTKGTRTLKRWDVSSHQKLTVDAIAEAMGNDDAHCLDLTITREPAPQAASTRIEIELLDTPTRLPTPA